MGALAIWHQAIAVICALVFATSFFQRRSNFRFKPSDPKASLPS
jgi:hypothetical protein